PTALTADASPGPLVPVQGLEAAEFYSLAIPDEDIIGRYVAGLLAGRRDWLQAVRDRSLRWRSMIAAEIASRGLPREIEYLPAVESGFQVRAQSPRGAMGLWQLMRNTASPYGLRMDVWIDERRDVWRATEASLDKLADNYRIYGDWYLALAAYNCGVGRLSGILRRNPGSDYWALRRKGVLPRETAAFVPQFLALSRILSYPGRYGLALDWEEAPAWDLIPLDKCVDLRILARAASVPLDVLMAGNPELNFPITPPSSYAYRLKVPTQYTAAVTEAIASAKVPMLDFRVHVVVEGDTLSEIAQAYRVSLDLIYEFNPRLNPRLLRLGTKVLIPVVPSARSS
ncbi:MAG TPA: transglycosylase SLT domain-containing protein, partial [Spirochaetia bacterium]